MQNKKLKQLTGLAMLAAISIVLVMLIRVPMPGAPFLEYDPADIPIFIGSFAYGPIAGLLLVLAVSILQGVTVSAGSGIIGILMHVFASGSFVLVSGLIYKRNHTKIGAMWALLFGSVTQVLTMVLWNLVFTPIFMGTPIQAVLDLMPIILLFNVLKAGINALVSFFVYKAVRSILPK